MTQLRKSVDKENYKGGFALKRYPYELRDSKNPKNPEILNRNLNYRTPKPQLLKKIIKIMQV